MSPLACSLLALAALLSITIATTSFEDPDPFCAELSLGERTAQALNYGERRHGGPHDIPDNCSEPGRKLAGVYIYACNPPHSKPVITEVKDETRPMRSFYIDCPSYTYGCESVRINVTEYCEPVEEPIQG